jgi:hypothetical protein
MDVACRLMIENYKLFLDGFMHGKEIKSSSLVWEMNRKNGWASILNLFRKW